MKSPILVRLAVLVVVMMGIAAGAVVGLLFITRTKTAQSAVTVLQKAQAAQSEAIAALGPNTTLHGISISHREQTAALRNESVWGLPDDTISEAFTTFDAAGRIVTSSSVVKGTDGHVYQRTDLVGGEMVTTDVASGQTISRCMHRVPCPTPPPAPAGLGPIRSVDDERALVSRAMQQIANSLGPSAMATTATVDGVAAYVVESYSTTTPGGTASYASSRSYIRQSDYWPMRSEQLAPDGHITFYSMQTVLEVLSNGPSIAVGAPSLASGNVSVPIMTTGAVANPYSGVNVHLRWDPSVFSYSSANANGSVLGSPVCPSAADSDGGGVVVGCTLTGGAATSVSGLVLTIMLTPKTGCSALHLFTRAGADGGDANTGTYTVNAADTHPQFNQYTDGTANVSGQTC